MMCSKRFLSLIASLIDKLLISVNTVSSEWGKCSLGYQIYIATQQSPKVFIHPEEAQAYRLTVIQRYKYVHVAVGALFAARIGAEEPSLQDGLRLEVLGYLLRHYLCGHI